MRFLKHVKVTAPIPQTKLLAKFHMLNLYAQVFKLPTIQLLLTRLMITLTEHISAKITAQT